MNLKKSISLAVLLLGVCIAGMVRAQESQNLIITSAWVRALPPTAKTTAGFLVIENKTDKEAVLTSVHCGDVQTIEIHQMIHTDGKMIMQKLESLSIPAQGVMDLEANGYHLMLINLLKPIQEGDVLTLTLDFEDGRSLTAQAVVKKDNDQESAMDHMHHH